MTLSLFPLDSVLAAPSAYKKTIRLIPHTETSLDREKDEKTRRRIAAAGFKALPGTILPLENGEGWPERVLCGLPAGFTLDDAASVAAAVGKSFSADFLKKNAFSWGGGALSAEQAQTLTLGWALAAYNFDRYKKNIGTRPVLTWPAGTDKKRVQALAQAVFLLRDLINTPANDMGPVELEKAAAQLARHHKAKFKSTVDGDLLKDNFPLIYAVGKGSARRPRLLDLRWGNTKNPRVTLVGKGVCFDTGGLDIKPSAFMYTMKKDMGGAAHALALAHTIISLNLPVCLRVLVPAVENSISGECFRPSDVIKSRKGLTVEISDTDAEGRLVLADALALACEEKPDLLLDFATLTGAARVALGYDLPAAFSRPEKLAEGAARRGRALGDPLWQLPLWQPYRREMRSDIADMPSIGTGKAGAIHAALFLESFVAPGVEWLHLDMFAWEQNGRPGRPRGGADTGFYAMLALIEERYARRKKGRKKKK